MPSNGKKSQPDKGVASEQRGVGKGTLLGYKIEMDNGVITRQEPIPTLMFWSPVLT
ncbi:hypothetical protein ACFLU6_03670 [Acidobacteriota bacterium]